MGTHDGRGRDGGVRMTSTAGCIVLAAALLTTALPVARGQASFAQSISLKTGWNAVYLEVDPEVSDPAALFAGLPVDIVASHIAPVRGAEFVVNPQADMLGTYGWAVWYAPSRADSFLTSLYGVYGATPYLIHATTNVDWAVSGPVPQMKLAWAPDAYNFVGFPLVDPGGPTFKQFFQGSEAHNHTMIYRLVDGRWRQVLAPASTAMRSGEAFWIYCRGRSDYPGPLEVTAPSTLGVVLTSKAESSLVFRNRTIHPVSFRLEHLVDPALPIPLSTSVRVVDESGGPMLEPSITFGPDAFVQQFPSLDAGRAIRLPLALRVQDAGPGERHSLFRAVSDLGTVTYVPVTATRDDLP